MKQNDKVDSKNRSIPGWKIESNYEQDQQSLYEVSRYMHFKQTRSFKKSFLKMRHEAKLNIEFIIIVFTSSCAF